MWFFVMKRNDSPDRYDNDCIDQSFCANGGVTIFQTVFKAVDSVIVPSKPCFFNRMQAWDNKDHHHYEHCKNHQRIMLNHYAHVCSPKECEAGNNEAARRPKEIA